MKLLKIFIFLLLFTGLVNGYYIETEDEIIYLNENISLDKLYLAEKLRVYVKVHKDFVDQCYRKIYEFIKDRGYVTYYKIEKNRVKCTGDKCEIPVYIYCSHDLCGSSKNFNELIDGGLKICSDLKPKPVAEFIDKPNIVNPSFELPEISTSSKYLLLGLGIIIIIIAILIGVRKK